MGRSTRGGGATKKKPIKKDKPAKRSSKKSATRLDNSDDSDIDGASEKEVKRTGGFHVSLLCCRHRQAGSER